MVPRWRDKVGDFFIADLNGRSIGPAPRAHRDGTFLCSAPLRTNLPVSTALNRTVATDAVHVPRHHPPCHLSRKSPHRDRTGNAVLYRRRPAVGSRPRCSLKYDDTFLVIDSHGDIGAAEGGPDGLFHNDTRFLSRLELTVNELQPLLLGSQRPRRQHGADRRSDQSGHLQRRPNRAAEGHAAYRSHDLLWRDTAYQRLGIRNHGMPVPSGFGSRFASTAISPICSRCAG